MELGHVYAEIIKSERDENGDLIVFGKATGPELDIDRQRMDPTWLKSAMPAWMSWGNIREQHSKVAAGIGLELEERDGGQWYLKSAVVDSETAKKVERGVLKGYSIGIKGPKVVKTADAPNGLYVGGEIVEISLVDRPANPTCLVDVAKSADGTWEPCDVDKAVANEGGSVPDKVDCPTCDGKGKILAGNRDCPDCKGDKKVTPETAEKLKGKAEKAAVAADMAKKDYSDEERAQLAKDGKALPIKNDKGEIVSGGYPIDTVDDLSNAVKAFGRAKDPAATKALIKKRAKALGRSDLIPDAWKGADATKADDVSWTHDTTLLAQVRNCLAQLMQAELDELQKGEREIQDLYDLLSSLQTFMWWWDHEASEGEDPPPYEPSNQGESDMDFVSLGVSPDVVKAAEASDAPEDAKKALVAEVQKALGVDADTLKVAVTDAVKGLLEERDRAQEERFKRIESAAAPGGPVTQRTTADAAKAAQHDQLTDQARKFRQLAEVSDRETAAGYRQKAAEAEAKAALIAVP